MEIRPESVSLTVHFWTAGGAFGHGGDLIVFSFVANRPVIVDFALNFHEADIVDIVDPFRQRRMIVAVFSGS